MNASKLFLTSKRTIVLSVGGLMLGFVIGSYAGESYELRMVRQVYDINAPKAELMYQFVPDYMEINVGDTVRFLGTVGRHTVHSVKGMIPEGAEPISIMPRQPNEVTFTKPGVYGIKCKLHQRHGMVAVIQVGDTIPNLEKARAHVSKGVSEFTRPKMHRLLDKAEASVAAKAKE
ncbi:MAG: plastocyanin/azurin family copper-binding protein [Chromatiales bacterium]|nr:plastocyanin/azurin family copper-binding protein [Chromatiales bacterium]